MITHEHPFLKYFKNLEWSSLDKILTEGELRKSKTYFEPQTPQVSQSVTEPKSLFYLNPT